MGLTVRVIGKTISTVTQLHNNSHQLRISIRMLFKFCYALFLHLECNRFRYFKRLVL